MDTTRAQQMALDDELVAPANRLKIGKSNLRLSSNLKSKEPTLQVVLDALKLISFYNAFEISADVLEIYMQEFWTFEEPPLEEAILSFIRDLEHTGEIKFLSDVNVNHMHQPWRSFAAIVNKCLSGKTTALESLRLSRAQILWGMYHNKKVDYVYLLWEDLVFQVENKNSKKNNDMYYPRFTKVIVNYFMAKDQAIPRRNKMFWHYARDDFMFTTVRVISKHQDTQVYGAILPQHLTNQAMLESEAYKTYRAYATGEKTPKTKSTKKKAESESSMPTKASKGKRIKTSAKSDKPDKMKQPAIKSKGLTVLSEVALSEADQMKLATKQSLKEFHSSHASGSGDGVDLQSKVPDEQQQTGSGTNEGAGDKPEVPDVPEYRSESEEESWTFSQGEDEEEDDEHDNDEDNDEHDSDDGNDDNDDEDDDQEDDSERTESDDDGDDFDEDDVMGGEQEDEDEELYSDLNINLNRRDAEMTDAQVNQETGEVHVTLPTEPSVVQQQSSSVSLDLVFINPSPNTVSVSAATETPSSDTTIPQSPIPIIQPQQQTLDSTTTTTIPTTNLPKIPNFASLFGFERRVPLLEIVLSELKQTNQFAEALSSVPGIIDKYLTSKMKDEVNVVVQLKSNKLREEAQAENDKFLKQIDSNIKNIIKDQVKAQVSKIMSKVEKYVTETLGVEVLARSSNQPQSSYATAASLTEFELKKILIDKIEENKSMNRSDVQKNLYNALIESYNSDKDILTSYGEVVTLKRGRDDQDKDEEPSAGSNRGSKRRRSGKEESSKETTQKESKSTSSSKGATRSPPKSSGKSTQEEEHDPRVDDLEEPFHQEFDTGNDDVSPVREVTDVDERLWNPSGSRTPDREWNQTKTVDDRPPQQWMTKLAQASGTTSSFNEFLATPIDFSAFIMNRLKIQNLTQDLLTDPTYDLIKGTCKSVVELEYHLEEVFKATNDQLDWHNPEGRPYPHDLSKPLPLIPDARGRQIIPYDHFINNDLEYLKGGSSSRKYTTSITKTKAADYGHVKWIEDKVPRSTWSAAQVVYDKHAYWGTYHWGPKR
ncbi:hypothetical protein Tco_0799820 [Tanacetum coccineum]|uniref:Monodehydroascorbate reductase n=1 Tax=Tanacetum coccineum TaxID=301880 RepID=A0ABQ4ZSE3_9ASTR